MFKELVYLDTCIISGLAKEDLTQNELNSLLQLLKMSKSGDITLVTSLYTFQEIKKIPKKYRNRHEIIYNLISDLPQIDSKVTNSGIIRLGVGKSIQVDPIFNELKTILPGEKDALHIYQAIKKQLFILCNN